MGFRNEAYATLWEVRSTKNPKIMSGRLTVSRKKPDGTWDDEFNQWVKFIGKAREKAEDIDGRTRIKILECDTRAPYDMEAKATKWYEFIIFDFETMDGNANTGSKPSTKAPAKKTAFEYDGDSDEEDVPF